MSGRLIKHLLANKYESLSFSVRLGLFLVDLAGTVLFFPCRLFRRWHRRYDPRDIKKILILRMDGLGDLVISTAALREIRKGFPEAEITLAIGPWSQGIAPCIPFQDHLIIHDAFAFGIFRGERRVKLGQEWAFIRRLREEPLRSGNRPPRRHPQHHPPVSVRYPVPVRPGPMGRGISFDPSCFHGSVEGHSREGQDPGAPRCTRDSCHGSGTGATCTRSGGRLCRAVSP